LHPFSFFLFSLLLQPWIQALYWLRVERVGHPCLISDLGKIFSFFTIQYNFSSQFVTYNVYQIEVQSFFFYFFSVFLSWRDVGFCHGLFLIYWGDHEIFSQFCLCVVSHLLICMCQAILASLEVNLILVPGLFKFHFPVFY
jgi:hypothetical protein